jgi:hypothetical protein
MDRIINDYLKTVGTNPMGEPLFRLVWSDSQHEKRHGVFDEYYGSLYVRTVAGVRDVPRYPYLKGRWILEMWRNGTYELLYVFEDKHRNALPLNLRVVQLVVHHVMERRRSRAAIESTIVEEENAKEEAELQHYMDMIDTSPIQNALHLKEAAGYGGVRRR